MCRMFVLHNSWSVYEKNRFFCPRVDVVLDYRLNVRGSTSPISDDFT